ncbi:hypothetical protein C8R43DRAFT_951855 [Mycena crocata]|nr:hypothetical protein C8R43DRAFT_951855 [Mycena crocata]
MPSLVYWMLESLDNMIRQNSHAVNAASGTLVPTSSGSVDGVSINTEFTLVKLGDLVLEQEVDLVNYGVGSNVSVCGSCGADNVKDSTTCASCGESISLLLSNLNGRSGASTVALSGKKEDDHEISVLSTLAAPYEQPRITPDFHALYSQREKDTPWKTASIPVYQFQRVRRYPSYIPLRNVTGAVAAGTKLPEEELKEDVEQQDRAVGPVVNMEPEQLRASLMNCVCDALEILPGEDFGEMSLSEPLGVRGIDSITFVNMKKRVEERHGLNISVLCWSDAFSCERDD